MGEGFRPRDAQEVLEAVRWAAGGGHALEIVAAGSLRGIGRPVSAHALLDVSGLAGVGLYEPEELVITVRPGTPVAEIAALLARSGQELAFEPPDFGPLFAEAAGTGTIGGILAGNLSGPRRIKAGAARDHFLGLHAVSGRGEAFKSGGRVVKNVTGYDLSRGLAGSWGTLCVMTEVTLKVLPAAETVATVILAGLDGDAASAAMSRALGSAWDVSGAAHLPGPVARRSKVAEAAGAGAALTALRLEGFAPSVAYRAAKLTGELASFAEAWLLDEKGSRALWREVRDASHFAGDGARPLWRLSVPPRAGGAIADGLVAQAGGNCLIDWGGGLVWYEPEDVGGDAAAGIVRGALLGHTGHATLWRGDGALRARIPVFQPQPAPLAALTRRLKASFDPQNILNPGRLYADGEG